LWIAQERRVPFLWIASRGAPSGIEAARGPT
jgi:hypothetical protein